jgi:hypothetical protein
MVTGYADLFALALIVCAAARFIGRRTANIKSETCNCAFLGTWTNVDAVGGSLLKIKIAQEGDDARAVLLVHTYGTCTSTCDRVFHATTYDVSRDAAEPDLFTASHEFGGKTNLLVGRLNGHNLIVRTYDQYTAHDFGSDVFIEETFVRERNP